MRNRAKHSTGSHETASVVGADLSAVVSEQVKSPNGEVQFDWAVLVPHFVHPLKVAIIEAMLWIDESLSAAELARVFLGEFDLSLVSYHLRKLADAGAVELVAERQVRGALQRLYSIPGA